MNNVDIQQWLAVIYNETVKAGVVSKRKHIYKSQSAMEM